MIRCIQESDFYPIRSVVDILWGKNVVGQKGCTDIRCITSPMNKNSIAFHTKWALALKLGIPKLKGYLFIAIMEGKVKIGSCFIKQSNWQLAPMRGMEIRI
jgi:hypothetical protein